ncbi:MAG: FHIPEP family type III secretion protein [Chlamydiales bacterium]
MRFKFKGVSGGSDMLLAVGVLTLVLLLVVPLPPILLDALLCLSIVFSLIVLLLTLYVENALEFSSFPSLLLFLTLYRLGLNIASTRMILTRGEGGDIIQTFGEFVTQGNICVGLILFALLTMINFIVVTKGAGRVAEVAARFTLESMHGKQMAIDGELASGLIDQNEARRVRLEIANEAKFYGAMDGASKFVRGDAIASVVITAVNIVGGFIVGFFLRHYSWSECWTIFTRLTVGDGLVTQIPALLISVGAGIIVTRASSGSLSHSLTKQMFNHPKVILMAGVMVLLLSFVPGMPFFVMLPISTTLLIYSRVLSKKKKEKRETITIASQHQNFSFSSLEVRLGANLVPLAEGLYLELPNLRKKIKENLGIEVGAIKIEDSLDLSCGSYQIRLRQVPIYQGRENSLCTMLEKIEEELEIHAFELINRQDLTRMIEEVRRVDNAVVEELVGKKLSIGQILKVLQNLLRERIPITDFVTILELLADHVHENTEIDYLTKRVREGLSRSITEKFFGKSHQAYVITLDPKVERMLDVATKKEESFLRPSTIDKIARRLIELHEEAVAKGVQPVVFTANEARTPLKRIIEKRLPQLMVFAYNEIESKVEIRQVGRVSNEVLL